MTKRTTNFFIEETYYKPPKENYITNKTEAYKIDGCWTQRY